MWPRTHTLSKLARQSEMDSRVDDATFEQELQKRLHMIESPDGPSLTVPDLPLLDFAVAAVALALATTLLMWWAY